MAVTAVTETVSETVQILSAVTETSPLRQFRRRNRNRNRNSVGLYTVDNALFHTVPKVQQTLLQFSDVVNSRLVDALLVSNLVSGWAQLTKNI